MPNAFIFGYYGASNAGDELMLACLRKWLASNGVTVSAVSSEQPEVTNQMHGVTSVSDAPLLGQWGITGWWSGSALALVRAIARADLFIIGGGDILKDHLGWRTYTYVAEKIALALLLRKKVLLLNVGIRSPVTRYGRLFLRWLMPKCKLIIVRDNNSEEACRQFGACENLRVFPDIVSYLPYLLTPIERTPEARTTHRRSEYIAICLRTSSNVHGQYEMNENRIANLAAALDKLVAKTGFDVVFIPFQQASQESGDDAIISRKVANQMRSKKRVMVEEGKLSLWHLTELVEKATCVLAMRLHAAVLGAAFGKQTIVMPYHKKVTAFARLADLHELPATALDCIERSTEILIQGIESVHHTRLPPYSECWGRAIETGSSYSVSE